jgi:hypothetical protein
MKSNHSTHPADGAEEYDRWEFEPTTVDSLSLVRITGDEVVSAS